MTLFQITLTVQSTFEDLKNFVIFTIYRNRTGVFVIPLLSDVWILSYKKSALLIRNQVSETSKICYTLASSCHTCK